MRFSLLIVTVCALLIGAIAVGSAQTANLDFTIAKVGTSPAIDGLLSDATWLEASQKGSKTVVDINDPGTELAPYPRVAYLAYDDYALYVSFITYVPDPKSLVSHHTAASQNDEVEIFIAPDHHGYHQFIITAAGDIQHNTRGTVTSHWIDVDYAVTVGEIAWQAEVAIPFDLLGHTPKPGDTWNFNLNGRQVGAGDRWLAWNPTYGSFHNSSRFGNLIFGE